MPPVRRAALGIGLCALLAAPAGAFVERVTKRGDLDADGELETVRALPVKVGGSQIRFTEVRVSDRCPGGRVDRRVAGLEENLERLRLRAADTRAGLEVFAVLRSGARGALGQARVVAWRPARGEPCRAPRALFHYDSDRHTRTPRGGNGDIAFFDVRLRNAARRFRGLEVALDERFVRDADPPFFGSIKKVTYWRYSAARDRYVRYRTVLRRVRVP